MRFPILLALALAAQPLIGSELGTWDLMETEEHSNIWSDYSEARPDKHPDAWLVSNLARFDGSEIMLKSSGGAMLRWVTTKQMRYLYATHKGIERVSELKTDLYLTRGDKPNAASGKSDGVSVVYVNFAMLDLIDDDINLWAALLGHEVAHLKLSHGDKRWKRNIPLTVLKTISQAVLVDPLSNMASGVLLDGVSAKFSRDDERQSDYLGVIWATQADFDPYGASRLHARMSAASSQFSIPFLGSHPGGPERIKTLSDLAGRLSKKSEL